ncbi:AimR family lysis-lysogeny pheromone receptor [Pontibacillus marinus]|uniref:Uncharacterized protein n=1 Tax=Pontibacillus marinus BH030004 = DSM 16465 TaxID=1385511 RepID=A0A0A5G118_9BACI|nr:AimR family lysis-lysogeny pheromone receptor [Pontibacillus marinus]KGX84770.1 hypothetical protein N783_16160 [Pontibacillus marinus BH030004 = DSM 16465]
MCDNNIENQHEAFKPFRLNEEESPLSIVYKAFTAQYDPDPALHLVRDFCLTSTSIENQRKSLEFLYMRSFFKELDEMIEINKKSERIENRQWAELFDILITRRRKNVDHYQILDQIKNIKPVSSYVELYKQFITIYCYHELRQSGKLANYLDSINDLIEQVEDPLMLMFFQERMEDYHYFYHFQRNELILCRMYGFRLLKKPHNIYKNCLVHRNIALTYLFESYEQAMYHINEALRIAKEMGYTLLEDGIVNNNIPFIAAVNGKYEGISTTNPVEQAHLNIAKGNIDEALSVLEKIENPSQYQEYYLGKALKDKARLMNSYNRFIQQGDYFGAKLPFTEIQKLRENISGPKNQRDISIVETFLEE